jgi:phage shock protein A
MSETAKGEKPVPTDAQLQSELSHLRSMVQKRRDHLKEMEDRIHELETQLGVKLK